MHEFRLSNIHIPFRKPNRYEKSDRCLKQKVENVNSDAKPQYSIEQIIDKVKEGDLSIFAELNIPYTEITTKTGDEKYSFKYEGTRYTVNVVDNVGMDDEAEQVASNNTQTIKNNNRSHTAYEYSEDSSPLLKNTEYDKDYKITQKFLPNEDSNLENLAMGYQKQMDDISAQALSLNIPIPPNSVDYKKSDGSIDNDAYNEAMHQYFAQKTAYEDKIDELNNKSTEIYIKLQQVNKHSTEIEFQAKIENIENAINSLKNMSNVDNGVISTLETTLENIKQNISGLPNKKFELQSETQNIYNQIANIHLSNPPFINDFEKADGSVDKEGYKAACDDYERQKQEFEEKVSRLNVEASVLDNETAKIDMEIQERINKLDQLEKDVNAIKSAQDKNSQKINDFTDQEKAATLKEAALVLNNKIAQLRASGNSRIPNRLKSALNAMEKELNSIQKQRKSLLNREDMS